jgi:ABC-type protease/lipase transport system fused ATPase/permease subunit
MTAVLWAITAIAAAATVWHGVTEHHLHLRLLRCLRPGTVVPRTTHDTWWHALSRSRRIIVQVALTAAGLAAGIACEAAPAVAITVLAGSVVAGTVLVAVRTAGRTRG